MTAWEAGVLEGGRLEETLQLVAACYGRDAEPEEWWRWRYFSPKAPKSRFLVVRDQGRVIGMQPLSIEDYLVDGHMVRGASLTGGMVHPGWRRRGVFSALVAAAVNEAWALGAAFVVTMPNERSLPAFLKMGWIAPGERTLLVRVLLPTPRDRTGREPLVAEVDSLSPESGRLACDVLGRAGTVALRRTDEWLQWRFAGNPLRSYGKIEARRAGRVRGYAVVTTGRRAGIDVGYLVDLVASDDEAADSLSRAASAALKRRGARIALGVVSTPGSAPSRRYAGFFSLPRWARPKRFHLVFTPNPDRPTWSSGFHTISRWHLALADWDGV